MNQLNELQSILKQINENFRLTASKLRNAAENYKQAADKLRK